MKMNCWELFWGAVTGLAMVTASMMAQRAATDGAVAVVKMSLPVLGMAAGEMVAAAVAMVVMMTALKLFVGEGKR